ncbi:MAG: hypothetical protein WC631_00135 [Candidatus Paceibacterota bacterium]|jgi:hypothetical protein
MLLELKTKVRRYLNKALKTQRPTSYPYISGDSFRNLAQHIFDESMDFDPKDVSRGDIIFVRTNFLKEFSSKINPLIDNPYILISHNEDMGVSEEMKSLADDNKVIHWFAENLLFEHKKITPIPIGIDSRIGDKKNIIINSIKKYSDEKNKITRLFYSFWVRTNFKKRIPILEEVKKINLADTLSEIEKETISKEDYLKKISKYKFIISPPGNGLDCHRTWETIYLKSIPIVEASIPTEYWKSIGIPLMVIEKWDKLKDVTEKEFEQIFVELSSKTACPALRMDYWVEQIRKYKDDYC